MTDAAYALRTHLLLDTAIAAAFGDRIYINKVEDGVTAPFAKISLVAPARRYTHDGPSLSRDLYQVDVYDDEEVASNTYAKLIETALDGFRGAMGDVIVGMAKAVIVSSSWDPPSRHFRKIVEVTLAIR